MSEKVKFYWARIGDGNYEPVAVKGTRPNRMAYTLGCPDPIPVDGPDSAVLLATDEYDRMEAPLTPEQEERARKREARWRAQNNSHGYAGFGRKLETKRERERSDGRRNP